MKNIMDIVNEQQSFGYTWQNAFVVTIVKLFLETGEKHCKQILNQWFNDEKSASELYNFLYRLGYEPKSKSVDDLMKALMKVSITDKFTIK